MSNSTELRKANCNGTRTKSKRLGEVKRSYKTADGQEVAYTTQAFEVETYNYSGFYTIELDEAFIQKMIKKAVNASTNRCKAGPVVVKFKLSHETLVKKEYNPTDYKPEDNA